MTTEGASQNVAQVFDDADSSRTIVVAYQHGNGVERVEKEMRIELCLECGKARARKLFRESGQLDFTFARLDEVTRGVFYSDHAEIDRNPERERRKDPA